MLSTAGVLLFAALAQSASYRYPRPTPVDVGSDGIGVELLTDTTQVVVLRLASTQRAPTKVELAISDSRGSVTTDVELPPGAARLAFLPFVPSSVLTVELRTKAGRREASIARTPHQPLLAVGSQKDFERVAGCCEAPDWQEAQEVVLVSPSDLPQELSSLRGFGRIAVLEPRWDGLPQAAQAALEAYAATGGALVITGASAAVGSRLPLLATPSEGRHTYGFGAVRLCFADRERCTAGLFGDLGTAKHTEPYGQATPSPEARNYLLPRLGIAVEHLLVPLSLFFLAVGPLGFLLARRLGRGWLLGLAPACATLACMAMAGYAIYDGLGVRAATCSAGLVDRRSGRLIRAGVAGLYGSFRPGEVTLGHGAALMPHLDDLPSLRQSAQGTRITHGLLPPRTYRELGFLEVTTAQRRLIARPDQGNTQLRVENVLGGPIKSLRLNLAGRLWRAEDIPAGGVAEAQPTNDDALALSPSCAGRVLSAPGGRLRDGEFVALLAAPLEAPFGGLDTELLAGEALLRGEVTR